MIERNRVWDHDLGGIVVITYPESAEYVWKANGNMVRDNVVHDNRLGDLGIWFGTEEKGNCFADNDYGTTSPLDLEQALPCTGTGTGDLSRGGFDVGRLATNEGKPEAVPVRGHRAARGAASARDARRGDREARRPSTCR